MKTDQEQPKADDHLEKLEALSNDEVQYGTHNHRFSSN